MLIATMLATKMVLKPAGSPEEYRKALAIIRSLPRKDCMYDEILQRWMLSHPEKYRHITAIKAALQDHDRQLSFDDLDAANPIIVQIE